MVNLLTENISLQMPVLRTTRTARTDLLSELEYVQLFNHVILNPQIH
jgi:hypothetical protein